MAFNDYIIVPYKTKIPSIIVSICPIWKMGPTVWRNKHFSESIEICLPSFCAYTYDQGSKFCDFWDIFYLGLSLPSGSHIVLSLCLVTFVFRLMENLRHVECTKVLHFRLFLLGPCGSIHGEECGARIFVMVMSRVSGTKGSIQLFLNRTAAPTSPRERRRRGGGGGGGHSEKQ